MSKLQVEALTAGPRGPDGLTASERALLVELRQQGYELVADWCTGPHGTRYEHRRVIRRRGAA